MTETVTIEHAAAFLFSTPAIAATSASVTAFCDQCWHDPVISDGDIAAQCERVLSAIIPGGRLERQATQR
jgi:hypothetical protein